MVSVVIFALEVRNRTILPLERVAIIGSGSASASKLEKGTGTLPITVFDSISTPSGSQSPFPASSEGNFLH